MNKDYKHLSQDKLADEGKVLYYSGKRITGNKRVTSYISNLGILMTFGASYAHDLGYIDSSTAVKLMYTSLGASFIARAKEFLDEIPNKRLRAYYSHTSNY